MAARWANGRLDWADAAVPVLASLYIVMTRGQASPALVVADGLGRALTVAVLFIGVRQVLWAVNRRRAVPRPRQPLLAAMVGLAWAFIIFRH